MRLQSQRLIALLFVASVCLQAGCGGVSGPAGVEGGAPVKGTITYKGAPVEGATVTFHPASGGKAAFGMTDAQGVYQLTTQAPQDGAVPGEYTVTVSKVEIPASASVPEDHPDYGKTLNQPEPEPKSLLPEKYRDPKTSDLKGTVASGENQLNFELKD